MSHRHLLRSSRRSLLASLSHTLTCFLGLSGCSSSLAIMDRDTFPESASTALTLTCTFWPEETTELTSSHLSLVRAEI